MKSDARLLLNKRKWKKESGNSKSEIWRSRGTVDARKILNLKRRQKTKPPVLGSYMRTKTATAFIASQIRKQISPVSKVPDKRVQLSRDGNIIVTSKSKNTSKVVRRHEESPKFDIGISSKNRSLQLESMQSEPSTSNMDDLEYTAVDDELDFESLPPALVTAKPLSRQLPAHTMVADQISQHNSSNNTKILVSNLHPSVSRQDVMELFGDIGIIKGVDMLMPGTALIYFYDKDDAKKACDIYHNRLLDGLPMKCYLQSEAHQQRSAISERLGERVVPYRDTTQKTASPPVLTNSRSRYNPRNVQFTVKLT